MARLLAFIPWLPVDTITAFTVLIYMIPECLSGKWLASNRGEHGTNILEVSHLCHNGRGCGLFHNSNYKCISPYHLTLEMNDKNMARQRHNAYYNFSVFLGLKETPQAGHQCNNLFY